MCAAAFSIGLSSQYPCSHLQTQATQRVFPLCLADSRPPAIWSPGAGLPERNKLIAYLRTSCAVSFAPALPSPRWLGWRSIVFFPEYHLKWQGLFHKGRSGTTLICMCSTLAQLFLRLLNYSQGTQCELLWGLGSEHCVQVLRLCTAQLRGRGATHADVSVYQLHDL